MPLEVYTHKYLQKVGDQRGEQGGQPLQRQRALYLVLPRAHVHAAAVHFLLPHHQDEVILRHLTFAHLHEKC